MILKQAPVRGKAFLDLRREILNREICQIREKGNVSRISRGSWLKSLGGDLGFQRWLEKPPTKAHCGGEEMKTANEHAKHIKLRDYIVTDPDILGGEPVFRGTRVPVVSLFEHLESDCPLDEFLENFPSVSREAAVAVIMGAQALILERASR
jgi:uncharacterized protein (DUF433 family)